MESRKEERDKKRKTREIKRLTLKIEMLSEDLEEHQEVLQECESDYTVVISVLLKYFKKKKAKPEKKSDNSVPKIEEDVEKLDSPAWAKKLFKKIAKETHPDKLQHANVSEQEKEKKKKMYQDSLNSINEGDFSSLVDTAIRLGVETGMSHPDIKSYLGKKVEKLESQIKEIKSKFSWVWFHSDNETRILIIEKTCSAYGIKPTQSDIEKIMRSIQERDLTVLTSRRPDRKVGQRPARIERK